MICLSLLCYTSPLCTVHYSLPSINRERPLNSAATTTTAFRVPVFVYLYVTHIHAPKRERARALPVSAVAKFHMSVIPLSPFLPTNAKTFMYFFRRFPVIISCFSFQIFFPLCCIFYLFLTSDRLNLILFTLVNINHTVSAVCICFSPRCLPNDA